MKWSSWANGYNRWVWLVLVVGIGFALGRTSQLTRQLGVARDRNEVKEEQAMSDDARPTPLAVGCSVLCVPSMGTVLMGLEFPVDKPDMTKTYS
jgi:hypothetical protein